MIVGWFGYGGHAHMSEVLRADLLAQGITLRTMHEWPNADQPYTPAGVFDFIDSCDVVILPSRWQLEPAKSVNRLALSWSRKKAVVASPLPAYKQYGSEGKNILFAETQADWIRQLVFLRDNPDVRQSLGNHGYNEAQGRLNPRTIVDEVFNQLLSVGAWHPWKPDTFVQVIIPHYAPRLDYLKLAVDAIWKSDGPPRDVLVVSSSALAPTSEHFDSRTRIHHQADRLSFSQANNVGLRMVDPRATHFLLLNDDTIMSSHGLAGMLEAIGNRTDIIVNPYSNCDKGWLHNDSISVENLDLVPNMTIEAVGDRTEAIRHYNAPADKTLHPTTFCAMYSTLIPKNVFERVGFLGTAFSNGGEDYDYSERARKFGFQSYWTRNAWCFHFGGKTRKVAEDENFAAHHEEDFKNNDLVQKKWRTKQKKIVGIWTGPAWETWDLRSYLTGGIGGSECVEGRMAELFAENGYTVFMYGAHERKEQNGVFLVPWNEFKPEEEFFDLFIASRNVNCIDDRLRARRILVHVHDIWLLSGKHISDYHRSRVDKFVCLSPWHKQFVMEYHGLPADKITIIPNGVNTHLFAECDPGQKTYAKMVFSSSPDRGLDNILACLPWIKDQVPEFSLDVYYGTYNWESSARSRNDPDELRRIDSLMNELDKHKAFVNNVGRVPEPELAKAYRKAYLWSMMSTFTETYCCHPSTEVRMADGSLKYITDIDIDDSVLTHTGSAGNVEKVLTKPFSGHLVAVRTGYAGRVLLTPEHPVLVLPKEYAVCGRANHRVCDKNIPKCLSGSHYKQHGNNYTHQTDCKRLKTDYNEFVEWRAVADLRVGDRLCVPYNNLVTNAPNFYSLLLEDPTKYDKHSVYASVSDFQIDEEFLEVCGWYLAEGCFNNRAAVLFALNKHTDNDGQNKIIKFFESHGVNCHVAERGEVNLIYVYSTCFGRFFQEQFGRGARNKFIPHWIKTLDQKLQKYFLRGYLHGDGNHSKNFVRVECGSVRLVHDLADIFPRLGLMPSVYSGMHPKLKRAGKKVIQLEEKEIYFSVAASLSGAVELCEFFGYACNPKGRTNLLMKDDKYVYVPIRSLDEVEYEGIVWNLEIAGDNSYLTPRLVVHNCISAKQAQATATPIVCTNIAALDTTVGKHGIQIMHHPYSREGRQFYIDYVVKLCKDKDFWHEWSKKSLDGIVGCDWPSVWTKYWQPWC